MTNTEMTDAIIDQYIENDIDRRVLRLQVLLKKSAHVWLEVAKEVNDAKKCLSKCDFDQFLKKASLSQSIADKMPRIAEASILYIDESQIHLEKLEGWTTLYEVAKLPETNVREMYKELERNPDQALTRSFIQQFKSKQSTASSKILTVATITLSEDDIKRLDYDEYLRFREALDAVQRIIDRSITAASISIHAKSLEKVEEIILNQPQPDADENTTLYSDFIEVRALTAANTDCSDISTKAH